MPRFSYIAKRTAQVVGSVEAESADAARAFLESGPSCWEWQGDSVPATVEVVPMEVEV